MVCNFAAEDASATTSVHRTTVGGRTFTGSISLAAVSTSSASASYDLDFAEVEDFVAFVASRLSGGIDHTSQDGALHYAYAHPHPPGSSMVQSTV